MRQTRDQTDKHHCSLSGTRQNPTLVNNLTEIGSTQSLEEHQLHAWRRSAFRGNQNIRDSRNSSIKIHENFASIWGAHVNSQLFYAAFRSRTLRSVTADGFHKPFSPFRF